MSEPTNQDYLDVADMLDDEPIKGEHLLPHNPNRTKAETRRLLTERDRVIKQFNIATIEKQSGGRKSRRKRKSRKGRKSRRKRKSRKGRK